MASADFLGNIFGSGSINLPLQSIINIFIMIGAYLFMAVSLGAVVYIVRKLMRYDAEVMILIKKGSNIVDVKKDKCREIYDEQGKPVLQCLRIKKGYEKLTTPRPKNKFSYKKGKRTIYLLWMDDNQQCHPIKIGFKKKIKALRDKKIREEIKQMKVQASKGYDNVLRPIGYENPDEELKCFLKPIPHERLAWARLEDKKQAQKLEKKNALRQFFIENQSIIVGMITFLILFFFYKYLGNSSIEIAKALKEIAVTIANL